MKWHPPARVPLQAAFPPHRGKLLMPQTKPRRRPGGQLGAVRVEVVANIYNINLSCFHLDM